MKKFFTKLGKWSLFYFTPVILFILFFPYEAFYSKYLIAKDISPYKIEKALFILPLYSNIFKDGVLYLNLKINPFSQKKLVASLNTRNLIINYQGFTINFAEGFGKIEGNIEKVKYFYRAENKRGYVNIKGYFLPRKKFIFVKGVISFENMKFPVNYKGYLNNLLDKELKIF